MELLTIMEKYWSIIVAFIAIVISYANLKAQNLEQEKRLLILEGKVEHMNPIFTQILERLASIEATLKIVVADRRKK